MFLNNIGNFMSCMASKISYMSKLPAIHNHFSNTLKCLRTHQTCVSCRRLYFCELCVLRLLDYKKKIAANLKLISQITRSEINGIIQMFIFHTNSNKSLARNPAYNNGNSY